MADLAPKWKRRRHRFETYMVHGDRDRRSPLAIAVRAIGQQAWGTNAAHCAIRSAYRRILGNDPRAAFVGRNGRLDGDHSIIAVDSRLVARGVARGTALYGESW